MSEITKPILLNETGQETNQKLDTLAAKEQLIADAINNVAQNYTDIHAAAVSAQQQATAAAASAAAADNSAGDAADSAAAAAQKLDDLEAFLSGLDPESAASVAAELGLFEQEVASDYAKKDGYYEQMGVGTADNLAGHGTVNAEYTYRTAGGDSDIGTGAAAIDTVKGNTLVWNQLVTLPQGRTNNGITFTSNSDGSITVTGTASADATSNILVMYTISGHKYLIKGCPDSGSDSTYRLSFANGGVSELGVGKIFTSDGTQSALVVSVRSGYAISGSLTFWPQLIDLTKMFGSGKEPSTVAEFEALYPLNYYDYNSGTLINNSASGIKTIGFNQWDEEWQKGIIKYADGTIEPSTANAIVSKNFIPVLGGNSYYFSSNIYRVACYDINQNYIQSLWFDPQSTQGVKLLDSRVSFIRFQTSTSYGEVYKNDICINLSWSGYHNGEYEPYEEHTVYFDSDLGASESLATIKGRKLNAQGEPTGDSVVVFPDGMKSVDTFYDEAKGQSATKRILALNMGELQWTLASANRFIVQVPLMKKTTLNATSVVAEMLSAVYTVTSRDNLTNQTKSISAHNAAGYMTLNVYDTSYSDAPSFIQGVNNIMLYVLYETPETYLLDNPLPVNYVVNDFGTEQRLPADTSSSVMAPILYSVQYAMNATDTIRRLPINYISKDSFDNFCASLASAIGPYLNPPATIAVTPTYNDNTQEYDYQVTVTPTENNG